MVSRKSKTDRAEIIAALKARAAEIRSLGVVSLALFGSRARGDEQADSDLDVLIGYDRRRKFSLYDLVGVEHFISDLTGLAVHVSTRDALPADKLQGMLRDAVKVL
ncbi:MAG: hypothetical protein E6G91_17295 [Alphaproteobacteria bacterium]|nr:MAG: hypothetical protein E6G91_17295 [Alphaproteobacteria bacterium]